MAKSETMELAAAIRSAAHHLGNGNASTDMGAIENLAKEIKEGTKRIAEAIESLADAVTAHGTKAYCNYQEDED